jgi:putative alpha-1,2-mannosidase
MRCSRAISAHQFTDTEQDVLYKGFPGPGDKDPRQRAQIEGRQLVGALDFDDAAGQQLIVKVAISAVSEDNAIANLETEVPGWDFDAVRRAARAQWTEEIMAGGELRFTMARAPNTSWPGANAQRPYSMSDPR